MLYGIRIHIKEAAGMKIPTAIDYFKKINNNKALNPQVRFCL